MKSTVEKTFFDDLLKILLFGFIKIGIAASMAIQTPESNIDYTLLNMTVGGFLLFELAIVLPLTYCLILGQTQEVYNSSEFKGRLGQFLLGIKIIGPDSWTNQCYLITFLFTRYCFMLLAFVKTTDDGCFDVMLLMTLFLFNTVMFWSRKPLNGKWNNILGRFNTLILLACSYHMIMFSDFVQQDTQYLAGWSLVFTIFLFLVVNLLYLSYDLLDAINKILMASCGRGLWW